MVGVEAEWEVWECEDGEAEGAAWEVAWAAEADSEEGKNLTIIRPGLP